MIGPSNDRPLLPAVEQRTFACPRCGAPLEERGCEFLCLQWGCGFHLSCADLS